MVRFTLVSAKCIKFDLVCFSLVEFLLVLFNFLKFTESEVLSLSPRIYFQTIRSTFKAKYIQFCLLQNKCI